MRNLSIVARNAEQVGRSRLVDASALGKKPWILKVILSDTIDENEVSTTRRRLSRQALLNLGVNKFELKTKPASINSPEGTYIVSKRRGDEGDIKSLIQVFPSIDAPTPTDNTVTVELGRERDTGPIHLTPQGRAVISYDFSKPYPVLIPGVNDEHIKQFIEGQHRPKVRVGITPFIYIAQIVQKIAENLNGLNMPFAANLRERTGITVQIEETDGSKQSHLRTYNGSRKVTFSAFPGMQGKTDIDINEFPEGDNLLLTLTISLKAQFDRVFSRISGIFDELDPESSMEASATIIDNRTIEEIIKDIVTRMIPVTSQISTDRVSFRFRLPNTHLSQAKQTLNLAKFMQEEPQH